MNLPPSFIALARIYPSVLFEVARKSHVPEVKKQAIAGLRAVEREASLWARIRMLSDRANNSLRSRRDEAEAAVMAAAERLAMQDDGESVLIGLAAAVQHSLARFDELNAEGDALQRKIRKPLNELRGIFRSPPSTDKLAQMLGLHPQELPEFEARYRRYRRRQEEVSTLLSDERKIAAARLLLEDIKAFRRRSRGRERTRRAVATAVPSMQSLQMVELPVASFVAPRSLGGKTKPRLGIVADTSVGVPPNVVEENALIEIGAHGESMVFKTLVWPAWAKLLADNRASALSVVRRIVAGYWTIGRDHDAALASLETADEVNLRPLLQGIVWPASTQFGDAIGFDMFLPVADGEWRCVEVKTTVGPPSLPFLMTRNEMATAEREGARYCVYRVGWAMDALPELVVLDDVSGRIASGRLDVSSVQFSVRCR